MGCRSPRSRLEAPYPAEAWPRLCVGASDSRSAKRGAHDLCRRERQRDRAVIVIATIVVEANDARRPLNQPDPGQLTAQLRVVGEREQPVAQQLNQGVGQLAHRLGREVEVDDFEAAHTQTFPHQNGLIWIEHELGAVVATSLLMQGLLNLYQRDRRRARSTRR